MHTYNNNKYSYGIMYSYSIFLVCFIVQFYCFLCYIYWMQNKIIKEQGFRLSQRFSSKSMYYTTVIQNFSFLITYYATIITGQYNILPVGLLFVLMINTVSHEKFITQHNRLINFIIESYGGQPQNMSFLGEIQNYNEIETIESISNESTHTNDTNDTNDINDTNENL